MADAVSIGGTPSKTSLKLHPFKSKAPLIVPSSSSVRVTVDSNVGQFGGPFVTRVPLV